MQYSTNQMSFSSPQAVYRFVATRLTSYIGTVKQHTNGLNFRCPLCGDSATNQRKTRGWLYQKSGTYYCWNCGQSCTGFMLLSRVSGRDVAEIRKDFYKENGIAKNVSSSKQTISLPNMQDFLSNKEASESFYAFSLTLPDIANEFLVKRKISEAPNLPKHIRFRYDAENSRLVIPWLWDKQVIYWQSRKLTDDKSVKYLFPSATARPLVGLDRLDKTFPYIFVFEGFFNSIFCKNGVAAGSLRVSAAQMAILDDYRKKGFTVVWAFDNPFKDTAANTLMKTWITRYPNDKFLLPSKNGPGSKLFQYKDMNDAIIALNDPKAFWDSHELLAMTHGAAKTKLLMLTA
jgi:predicted RNA-binding Zn-ribbon protein involved in translation (DUF1610 family)